MHETNGTAPAVASEDNDDLQEFKTVLTAINYNEVLDLCEKVRRQQPISRAPLAISPPVISDEIMCGSSHVLITIVLSKKTKWVIRIPKNGHAAQFDRSAASALTTEARTMILLRKKTTIPVPEVLAYDDSLTNPIGCPFILMERIEGINLYDCWHDKVSPAKQVEKRREQALVDIAAAMVQLFQFTSKEGGTPEFDENGNFSGVISTRLEYEPAITAPTPRKNLKDTATTHRNFVSEAEEIEEETEEEEEEAEEDAIAYMVGGPWATVESFYVRRIPALCTRDMNYQLKNGLYAVLRKLIDCIPPVHDAERFVLDHSDFDLQNIIVDKQTGRLQAIIDWDGVEFVPRSVGYGRYPAWLVRDWYPVEYRWRELMESGARSDQVWEDSPVTLERMRSFYKQEVRRAFEDIAFTKEKILSPPDQYTHNSLYVQNLLYATYAPCGLAAMMKMFFAEIERVQNIKDGKSKKLGITDFLITYESDGKFSGPQNEFVEKGMALMFATGTPQSEENVANIRCSLRTPKPASAPSPIDPRISLSSMQELTT